MRTVRWPVLMATALCLATAPAAADELLVSPVAPQIAQYLRYVQPAVRDGRLACTSPRLEWNGPRLHAEFRDDKQGIVQEVEVGLAGERSAVDLTLRNPVRTLKISIDGDRQVVFSIKPTKKKEMGPLIVFVQNPESDVTLSVTSGEEGARTTRAAVAPNLWRLLLEEPDLCREYLAEPLAKLWPIDLMAQSQEVVDALLFWARTRGAEPPLPIEPVIVQLGSHRFTKRRAAQRTLEQYGLRAVAALERLDPAGLDAEQQRYVRDFLARHSEQIGGSPGRIAERISADPFVWLALLSRDGTKAREVAATQLRRLLEADIEFDAGADEMQRAEQQKKIRELIEQQGKKSKK